MLTLTVTAGNGHAVRLYESSGFVVYGNLRRAIWHSNYGESTIGALKPELVAPSIRVVAPILPGTREQRQAEDLFQLGVQGDSTVLAKILEEKLVTRHYKLVEGTRFAAPTVASTIACMCEATPSLTPDLVRPCLGALPVCRSRAG